ncbi:MAG: hypothetical protein U5Q03_19755 [Bacteroidota bacterium]|nr:hypothetical protein [Bacteroidota bacterium]
MLFQARTFFPIPNNGMCEIIFGEALAPKSIGLMGTQAIDGTLYQKLWYSMDSLMQDEYLQGLVREEGIKFTTSLLSEKKACRMILA